MTIKVLEHNGIYTAYRRVVKRTDDGQLYESLKRIDFPSPPTKESQWGHWAMALLSDELDAGLQIYFDKWNFGNGSDGERMIYDILYNERATRDETKDAKIKIAGGPMNVRGAGAGAAGGSVMLKGGAIAGVQGTLTFPVHKK